MSCPANTLSGERTACPPWAGDPRAGDSPNAFASRELALYRSGTEILLDKRSLYRPILSASPFDSRIKRHEPKQFPLHCPDRNCLLIASFRPGRRRPESIPNGRQPGIRLDYTDFICLYLQIFGAEYSLDDEAFRDSFCCRWIPPLHRDYPSSRRARFRGLGN